ncbi:hypothetical protein BDZ97DRAFT_2059185 [Flammula alnicola]|nr:hypothetical protein BDZ97DRAFT_2059185 [Flammula alnicola]
MPIMVPSTTAQHHYSRGYDPIKCTLSEGKPCNPCLELTELDAQLAQALADFEQKRRLLKSKVNNLHDPLAHVPVEIASEIFTWYHEETYRPSIFGDSPESKQGSPLRLAAVCKTWREIAFKTPQLWTSLYIMHNPVQTPPLHLELVAQWLGRSSKMPLYIRLQYTYTEEEDWEDYVYPASLFALIRDYAPWWNALNLVMPTFFYDDFIRKVEGAPLLEYLRLSPIDVELEKYLPTFYLGKTPCLRSLDISRLYLTSVRIEWGNLTKIQFKNLGVDEILEVLSRGPRLVDCKFPDILENFSIFDLPTPFLVHNSLRYLHLHPDETTNEDLRVLYNRLVLPSLRHFSYAEGYVGCVEVDSLLSLFTRSRSPITHFSLAIPQSSLLRDYNTIIQILENLPSITHLSLTWMEENTRSASITNSFLRRMASFSSMQHDTDISRTNAFLPSLESFQYEEWWPSENLSWGCLADIFHNPVEDSQTVKVSNNIQQSQSSLPAIHYCNRRPSLRDFRMTFHSEGKNGPEPIELNEDLRRLIGIRSAGVNLQILKVLHSEDVVDMIESSISDSSIRRPRGDLKQ